jgi:crotonobetainyl-CoA:carnitine CoA-transferase CaiB-like acyl-CoA transferase
LIELVRRSDVVTENFRPGRLERFADIFRDPQYQKRDMLVDHHDPEIGHFFGPGIVPKLSGTPGAVK